MRTSNQAIILAYIKQHGEITTRTANELLAHQYYHNGEHYVSMSLTRMVKSGIIIREGRGLYKPGTSKKFNKSDKVENQPQLF